MIETINGKYTIKQIFKDNWSWFLEKHQTDIRPVVIENVEKILACGDKDKMGYSLYQCPCCGEKKFVHILLTLGGLARDDNNNSLLWSLR